MIRAYPGLVKLFDNNMINLNYGIVRNTFE